MPPGANPVLCYVTGRQALAAAEPLAALRQRIRAAVTAGVDWVQVREKDLPARELAALVEDAVQAARGTATRIIVNDRLDVALAAGAGGIHLGGESLPVVELAHWRSGGTATAGCAPEGFLLGASCHAPEEVAAAERDGADYVIFGPVFDTPSKRAFGPPQGLARLEAVCRAARIPVMAIGGITIENAAGCLRAGAAGIAAIRLFQEAGDLAGIVAALRGK